MAEVSSLVEAGKLEAGWVEIVYAVPREHWQGRSAWHLDMTVEEAIAVSGFRREFPDWTFDAAGVGIHGRRVDLQSAVQPGDRIEIYRPLSFDPMVSRRRRAAHKARAHQLRFR